MDPSALLFSEHCDPDGVEAVVDRPSQASFKTPPRHSTASLPVAAPSEAETAITKRLPAIAEVAFGFHTFPFCVPVGFQELVLPCQDFFVQSFQVVQLPMTLAVTHSEPEVVSETFFIPAPSAAQSGFNGFLKLVEPFTTCFDHHIALNLSGACGHHSVPHVRTGSLNGPLSPLVEADMGPPRWGISP